MPSEIKFTNLGIPYLVEFANISIRSSSVFSKKNKVKDGKKGSKQDDKSNRSKKLPPPPVRCPTCGHLPDNLPRSATHDDDEEHTSSARPGGLYIRFASTSGSATSSASLQQQLLTPGTPVVPPVQKLSDRRLAKLRYMIAEAVTHAGMTTPATEEQANPLDSESSSSSSGRSAPNRSNSSESVRSTASKQSLFKGTYGQVKEALKNAGLTYTPCPETGFENATRLGALFVANSKNGTSELQLTKLTLWG